MMTDLSDEYVMTSEEERIYLSECVRARYMSASALALQHRPR